MIGVEAEPETEHSEFCEKHWIHSDIDFSVRRETGTDKVLIFFRRHKTCLGTGQNQYFWILEYTQFFKNVNATDCECGIERNKSTIYSFEKTHHSQ